MPTLIPWLGYCEYYSENGWTGFADLDFFGYIPRSGTSAFYDGLLVALCGFFCEEGHWNFCGGYLDLEITFGNKGSFSILILMNMVGLTDKMILYLRDLERSTEK